MIFETKSSPKEQDSKVSLNRLILQVSNVLIGAQLLVEQQQLLSPDEQYVRCAEYHVLEDGKPFYLIICMSRRMSQNLMVSEYLSIDTSFKRLHHNWQEFEIESWDVDAMRCELFFF